MPGVDEAFVVPYGSALIGCSGKATALLKPLANAVTRIVLAVQTPSADDTQVTPRFRTRAA